MKRNLFIGLLTVAISFGSNASTWANASGKISNIQVWANGSDPYGVWVTLESGSSIPSGCGMTYYLQHNASNKDIVYSSLLASKVSGGNVTIQTDKSKNATGLCRIHKVLF
ncbi:hypothetical protein [Pseudoalteromonas luteoviolacea]|uniref:Uncharacterized protein n=1 Tax=Pseudoalteromonas luteoviolacea S4054 TaxID=1129367 RepID=A0A0F6AGV2_9GAMM|nr:hypothetical protein [Pseudoalteromonas luteoviolacea]AOT07556.1 hypothetical protein S4054249_06740 [Pseudoalteromonas luteoviolacea]AOT12472.1 hypothetical protein S40542_06740 [Pseudoalteromonas luteoviolacea]AOT17386.1 hypothetical protein S4054_06740 [Pseudoalteromonas luteoviolacea]KKE84629.1 hypothetical protein N479_07935 [Pseudoalteromonas luteoviolacea S4054]KZN74271.1 hypothetical protein N481_09830 [Pseudoalteromonas luteoviolacea S4047-1]